MLGYSAGTKMLPFPQSMEAQITNKVSCERAPAAPSNSGNPALPLSNLPLCGCQDPCFSKPQKDPVVPTMSKDARDSTSLLKNENANFPTERRKAVTCYSVGGTRRPRFSEAQHFLLHQPAGVSLQSQSKSCNPISSIEWQSITPQFQDPCLSRCTETPYSPLCLIVGDYLLPS
jgi:hypothetical protein